MIRLSYSSKEQGGAGMALPDNAVVVTTVSSQDGRTLLSPVCAGALPSLRSSLDSQVDVIDDTVLHVAAFRRVHFPWAVTTFSVALATLVMLEFLFANAMALVFLPGMKAIRRIASQGHP